MGGSLIACMIDNAGHPVSRWLPHMQSSDFLRAAISRGERTGECWSELTERTRRGHAAQAVFDNMGRSDD